MSSAPARRMRADARRNHERLVTAARTAFAEHGGEASLEDIARRAGVGIGTLYRHFPTRLDLQEAAYRGDMQAVSARAHELAKSRPPLEALRDWLADLIDHLALKRDLAQALLDTYGKDSELFRTCHDELRAAGDLLLGRAQDAGEVRRDVELGDVLRLVNAVALAVEQTSTGPNDKSGMLGLVLDGLRYQS